MEITSRVQHNNFTISQVKNEFTCLVNYMCTRLTDSNYITYQLHSLKSINMRLSGSQELKPMFYTLIVSLIEFKPPGR